jgi:hypothetical protein
LFPASGFTTKYPEMERKMNENNESMIENEPMKETTSSEDSDADMAECSNGYDEPLVDQGLSDEQREQVQKCLKSRRVIQEDEILRLSKHVGSEWRQFGNALKFNFTKLDALAAETESQSDAVHKMVLDWMAWKKEKATVGRLSKALYLNKEWEAILSLTP